MEPELVGIKGGWAAVGLDWAVFGETKDDALRKYHDAEAQHTEISKRIIQEYEGSSYQYQ